MNLQFVSIKIVNTFRALVTDDVKKISVMHAKKKGYVHLFVKVL